MKLIMENWRSFLSEEQKKNPTSGWAFGAEPLDNKQVASLNQKIKSDREKELKTALSQGSTKDQWDYSATKRKSKEQIVADMIVLLDPTGQIGEINIDDKTRPFLTTTAEQISLDLEKIEKLEGRMKALEKHSEEWYGLELEKVALYSAVGLGLAAAVPVVGKIAKTAAKSQKTQKFARSAADIARRSLIASKVTGKMIKNSIEAQRWARARGMPPPEHIRKYRGWNNFTTHYEEELLNAELSYKKIKLSKKTSVRRDIEGHRKVLDPTLKHPHGMNWGELEDFKKNYPDEYKKMIQNPRFLTSFEDAKRREQQRIASGEQRVADLPGSGLDWYRPLKPLSKYKFIRVNHRKLKFYHGGAQGLRKGKVNVVDRTSAAKGGGGSKGLGVVGQAGFYATTDLRGASMYAGQSKGDLYGVVLNKDAKIYRVPEEMQKEAGGSGVWFLHLNQASQKELAAKGIDGLYNPLTGDVVIVNKDAISRVYPRNRTRVELD